MKRSQAKAVRQATTRAAKTAADNPPSPLMRLAFPILLALVAALQVAAPLIPSEAVWQGGGVELTLAWWLVATSTAVWLISRRLPIRWSLADWPLLVLFAWTLLSAQAMAWEGNPRSTWNNAWQTTALMAGYWAMCQLLRAPWVARALLAVVTALAVSLAVHGVYQAAIGHPAQRASYREASEPEKQRMLRENGVDPTPDSPERRLFEARLESTEPYATFGLANSLAGMLVPWTLLLLAIGLEPPSRFRLDLPRRIVWGVAMILLLLCLLLTKSRSAWLALLFGGGLLALEIGSRDWGLVKRWSWLVALILILSIGLGLFGGTLDREILTEAGLSLQYRLEYWEGARQMLADHPWLGCGPGNFQEYYTRYKPPQASETVADPHNWFWEVAATSGWLGGFSLAAFLALALYRMVRASPAPSSSEEQSPSDPGSSHSDWEGKSRSVGAIYLGSLLGMVVSLPLGILVGFPPEFLVGFPIPIPWLLGLPALIGVLWLLHPWVVQGTFSPRVAAIALAALLVNLLAAGGIGFAGVVQSLWLLAAAGMSHLACHGVHVARSKDVSDTDASDAGASDAGASDAGASDAGASDTDASTQESHHQNAPSRPGKKRAGRRESSTGTAESSGGRQHDLSSGERAWTSRDRALGLVAILVTLGLTFAMYLQTYRAVTESRMMLRRAPESRNYEQLEGWYLRAIAADPLDPVPWQQLAELSQLRWLEVAQPRYREQFEQSVEEARRRNQRSAAFADYIGRLHLRAYRSAGSDSDLARAEEAFRRAVELYPGHNMGHAKLAWIVHLAGKESEARELATQALELDALNPHWERQLAQQTIRDPGPGEDITGQPPPPPEGESAEELMRKLAE